MANIKVDHKQLEETAIAIESYVMEHKRKMEVINQKIEEMNASWKGEDYSQLAKEWQEIKGVGSTSDQMIKSLENYAEYLRFAVGKYKSAQSNAINKANRLPRY